MTISQRQFTLLSEMGISLWQRRALSAPNNNGEVAEKAQASNQPAQQNSVDSNLLTSEKNGTDNIEKYYAIDLTSLDSQQIFNDILLSLNLSADDIKITVQQLQLTLTTTQLAWQFTKGEKIELVEQCLQTPKLETISHSSKLKRQLWLQLQTIEQPSIHKQDQQ